MNFPYKMRMNNFKSSPAFCATFSGMFLTLTRSLFWSMPFCGAHNFHKQIACSKGDGLNLLFLFHFNNSCVEFSPLLAVAMLRCQTTYSGVFADCVLYFETCHN